MKKNLFIKSATPSMQKNVEEDYSLQGDIIEPFISYDNLRGLYASNLYHQRAIKIKAGLLSQIESSSLDKHLPSGINAKQFLYKLALNLETYGSAFMEKAGIASNFSLYNMNSFSTRIDLEGKIYQKVHTEHHPIEALHIKYDSILSDYYGEPDYLTIIRQIATLYKADNYNDKFFDNGAKPELAFIFENADPSDEQISAITDFVSQNFKGVENAHKNIILTTGEGTPESKPKIRIEQIGKVEDLSFSKLKEVGRDEIATAHGTPPRLLGIVQGNGLGGSGELIAQMQMFLETTIEPKMKLIEWFFKEQGFELTLKRFDLSTLENNQDVANELVKSGLITAIEKRNILG